MSITVSNLKDRHGKIFTNQRHTGATANSGSYTSDWQCDPVHLTEAGTLAESPVVILRQRWKDRQPSHRELAINLGKIFTWSSDTSGLMTPSPPRHLVKASSHIRLRYSTLGLQSPCELPTVLGWQCAFCKFGDFGSRDQLLRHYAVSHSGEVEVIVPEASNVGVSSMLEGASTDSRAQLEKAPEQLILRFFDTDIPNPSPLAYCPPRIVPASRPQSPPDLRQSPGLRQSPDLQQFSDDDLQRCDVQPDYETNNGGAVPDGVYENPLSLAGPRMQGRRNEWTSWSNRVVPGTLADLLPELDKIWDGGARRHIMRDQEEVSLPVLLMRAALN